MEGDQKEAFEGGIELAKWSVWSAHKVESVGVKWEI